jgi:hypothetical protein
MISLLLQTDPKKRPSCSDLLTSNNIIKEKIKLYNLGSTICEGVLLNTIKVPQKLNDINTLLPKMKRYSNFSLNTISHKDTHVKEVVITTMNNNIKKIEISTPTLTSEGENSQNTSASSGRSHNSMLLKNKLRNYQSKSPVTERGSNSSNDLDLSNKLGKLNIPPKRRVNNPIINLIRPVSQCPKIKSTMIREVSLGPCKENIHPNAQIKLKRIESGKPRIYINLCEPISKKSPQPVQKSNFLNCKPVMKKL